MTGGSQVPIRVFDTAIDDIQSRFLKYQQGYVAMSKGYAEANKERAEVNFSLALQQSEHQFKLERLKVLERAKLAEYEAKLKQRSSLLHSNFEMRNQLQVLRADNLNLIKRMENRGSSSSSSMAAKASSASSASRQVASIHRDKEDIEDEELDGYYGNVLDEEIHDSCDEFDLA